MNLLSKITLLTLLAGTVAHAQISGVGTTGSTAGSGRGTGSAGVQTGTGPDTSVPVGRYEGKQSIINETAAPSATTTQEKSSKKSKSARKAKESSTTTAATSGSPAH